MSLAWRGSIKKMLAERMLAAELTHHLANEDATSKNHRNGTTPKRVLAPGDELHLDIPRDRLSKGPREKSVTMSINVRGGVLKINKYKLR